MKATDAEIARAYERHGSVWKAGESLGMCGQSVHERVTKLGLLVKGGKFTGRELASIRELYVRGFQKGDGALVELCDRIGRPKTSVCKKAGELGLTNSQRKDAVSLVAQRAKRHSEWIRSNGHPRGMLGKTHSEEARLLIGEGNTAVWKRKTPEEMQVVSRRASANARALVRSGALGRGSWKHGVRVVGGWECFFRSSWEANYARYLESLRLAGEIEDWDYEVRSFKFPGPCKPRSYTPDFLVTLVNGDEEFHEVKGWMDERSKLQAGHMRAFYPEETLVLIDSKWFKRNRHLREAIPGWEA